MGTTLAEGSTGEVRQIDDEGDAEVTFTRPDGSKFDNWVFKCNLHKLKKLEDSRLPDGVSQPPLVTKKPSVQQRRSSPGRSTGSRQAVGDPSALKRPPRAPRPGAAIAGKGSGKAGRGHSGTSA